MKRAFSGFGALLLLLVLAASVRAETGYDAWLRYEQMNDPAIRANARALPECMVVVEESQVIKAAEEELARGIHGMLGRSPRVSARMPDENAMVIGTKDAVKRMLPAIGDFPELAPDGFWLKTVKVGGRNHIVITGPNERGVLYGTFALLRRIALAQSLARLEVRESPGAPIRFLDHWDNLDGSIERGYAGKSIFWENNHVIRDLSRVRDYARLMASVGINGCSINNVNADSRVASPQYWPEVARIAEAFRPWGVRAVVALNFGSPREMGGIDSFDPLDPRIVEFWRKTVDEAYRAIPDLAGFVLKADSEGRLGPSEYGRTHADAANVIARALKPHGGVLFYRGFVYNHRMDWRDPHLDRARAAYDNFQKLDGKFEDNVVIQIKHGPIDFQVREPASPLFAALEQTSQAIELQITQEYLGQQRHLCYEVPMWKEVLDFDLHAKGAGTPVKALVSGRTFARSTGGFVGVSNVGRDTNWLHHPLAMANLYGFGRLAWNPDLSSRQIAEEWTRLTFGHDSRVVKTIVDLQLASWPTYEKYTGPLGAGTLTDIIHVHFGPGVESSEYNGWGQWHRADATGIGMNRTRATGTGFIGQYRPAVAAKFESPATCPDELLLFFQHVPYTHRLNSGKTVIQHIYDSHYEGAEQAKRFVAQWQSLRGRVDDRRFNEVLKLQEYQAGHAEVWRDAICSWFLQKSGLPDARGRAGHFPNRVEAETMALSGYAAMNIVPWETASGGKAVQCVSSNRQGSASFRYGGKPGRFDLGVRYFDENDGVSRFKLFVAGRCVDDWKADDILPTPTNLPDGHSSARRNIRGLTLRPGDEIRVEGFADHDEKAVVDYVEIDPAD